MNLFFQPRLVVVAATMCLLSSAAQAEIILLKSGGKAEGEWLNTERDPRQPVKLRTPSGVVMTIAADQVQRIIVKSDVEKEYDARAPKTPNTIDGHWAIAEWCVQNDLKEPRQKHLESILKLDPNHEGARLGLGYILKDNQWVKPDDWMRSQGFVLYHGAWRTRQEVEIEVRLKTMEFAQKQWMQKVNLWCGQLNDIANGRVNKSNQNALANMKSIKDPAAAAALLDVIGDAKQSSDLRVLCIDILTALPGKYGTGLFIKLALEDKDGAVRDRVLDELEKQQSTAALTAFTGLLTDKDNQKVRRAGYCLGRLGNPEATLPLIEALVTKHDYIEVQGSPGIGGATFGGGPNGGLGGMSQGQSKRVVRKDELNKQVLDALTSLNPGVTFEFNEDAWRRWYAEKFTTSDVNLRRER